MPELRGRFLYPRAGWLSLGLLVVMALALAWSVQGAGWLEQMDYLVPLGIWAVVIGGLLGMVRGTIVAMIPISALTGAALLIWMIGGEYYTAFDDLTRLQAMRGDLIDWTVIVVRTGYPPQMSPYALGLGVLMWTTAFTAAYAVFRHHRVLDAILLMGAALIANMSATLTDLFGHLLLFVVAALLLWLRSSLVSRQDGWQRRRVNETLEVPPAIMRSGIIVAGLSVALAWTLTSVAVAAPLTGAWRNFDGVWTDFRDQVEGVFGGLTNSQARISGSSFGSSFTVSGEWVSNDAEVLVLAAERPYYLRTISYDAYNGRGFSRSDGPRRNVAAGDDLFTVRTSERPTVDVGVRLESVGVEMRQTMGRHLFTAGSPLEILAPVIIHEPNAQPLLGGIESPNALSPGESYEMAVLISEATEAQLASAGEAYPREVVDLYLDTSGITDRVAALAREITRDAESPYERAKALTRYFQGSEFRYATRGPEVPRDADLVDTFLFAEDGKTGYCEYYAASMVLMARSVGLPARVAVGFAPGEAAGDGLWLVREANAHAWAEIFFPAYGWQIFEATKNINPRFVRASGGTGEPAPPPRQGPDIWLGDEIEWDRLQRGIDAIPSTNPVPGALDPLAPEDAIVDEPGQARFGNAMLMVVILVLGVGIVWLQMRRNRRRWRMLPAGERVWRHLAAAAERAGIGPRPAETIYEYAGWLEEQLPDHGEPIRQVADGKVWQSYSGRKLNYGASKRLEEAWSSLRLPLLGLAIRQRLRRLVRRDAP